MKNYLQASEIIDWHHPMILERAQSLTAGCQNPEAIAQVCFEWVRDKIQHSVDFQLNPLTCRASEVLIHRTGFCFAKSHLLAALLRANRIPTGFCYQRLSINDQGAPFSLHGFNAIYLPDWGWYRVDARGNKTGINAQFQPPQEQLAFALQFPEEIDFNLILADPLPEVTDALQAWNTWDEFLKHLPDAPASLQIRSPQTHDA